MSACCTVIKEFPHHYTQTHSYTVFTWMYKHKRTYHHITHTSERTPVKTRRSQYNTYLAHSSDLCKVNLSKPRTMKCSQQSPAYGQPHSLANFAFTACVTQTGCVLTSTCHLLKHCLALVCVCVCVCVCNSQRRPSVWAESRCLSRWTVFLLWCPESAHCSSTRQRQTSITVRETIYKPLTATTYKYIENIQLIP